MGRSLSHRIASIMTPCFPTSLSLPSLDAPRGTGFRTEAPTNPDLSFRAPLPPRLPILSRDVFGSSFPPPFDPRTTFIDLVTADMTRDDRWDPTSVRPRREGSHVLVIDEAMITHAVRRVLGARYHVSECSSTREALDAIASGARYDVILCDVRMPGLSGKAFYEAVHDVSSALADRIVFLTAVGSFAPGSQFLHEVSCTRRLSKPFRNDELRLAIDDFLRASGRWKAA